MITLNFIYGLDYFTVLVNLFLLPNYSNSDDVIIPLSIILPPQLFYLLKFLSTVLYLYPACLVIKLLYLNVKFHFR